MVDKKALYQAILEGDANQSKSLAEEAVKEGVDPKSLLDESMIRWGGSLKAMSILSRNC